MGRPWPARAQRQARRPSASTPACSPIPAYGAVMPPIYQSSTFAFRDVCTNAGYDYTRSGNPTRAALEEALALLEGGAGATCTSTGMSAVIVALNLLPRAATCSAPSTATAGPSAPSSTRGRPTGSRSPTSTSPISTPSPLPSGRTRGWSGSRPRPTRCCASPTSAAVAALARRRGALTVVDNTFLSPVSQQPFRHGADLVVHSTTKYLNGHSDVVGGAVVAAPGQDRAAPADPEREQPARARRRARTTPSSSSAASRPCCSACARTRPGRAPSPSSSPRTRRSRRCITRGSRPTPSTRSRAAQQYGFGGMVSFELGRRQPRARRSRAQDAALVHARREPWRAWRAWSPTPPR